MERSIRDILGARVRRGIDLAVLVATTLGSLVTIVDLLRGTSHEPIITMLGLAALAVCALLGVLGRARWTPFAYITLIILINAVYLSTVGVWFGLGTVYILAIALAFLFISVRGAWLVAGVFVATPLVLGVLYEVGALHARPALLVTDVDDWWRAASGSIGGLVGIVVVASYAVRLLIDERTKLEDAHAAMRAQRLERERVDAELARVRRVEQIAQLAAEVGAEIGAAIDVIRVRAAALALELHAPDSTECLSDIAEATKSAAATMRSLAILAPGAELDARGDVGEAVAALGKLVRRVIPPRIALEVAVDGESWVGIGTTDLTRIVANLALNARDAIEGEGTISIAVARETSASAVTISVADTGSGMSPEVQARLFQPFFTTKPVGRGTGLGLATAKILVDHAGGTFAVTSQLGRGTTFSIRLPML
jgi:signal transduction histidine kinase